MDESLAIPDVWRYRVERAEHALKTKADKDEVERIAAEVKGLRSSINRLLMGIVGSAVLVSFTLFATLGSHLAG